MDQSAGVLVTQPGPGFDRWDELLGLIMRAFAPMDGVIDPPSSAHLLNVENLRDRAGRETVFLALRDGRIAGCVFALERTADVYVGKLAVEPEFQGQGIGGQLMQAVEEFAGGRNKSAIELQTRIELTANHATFDRLGFRETARTAHQGYDRPTSITMRKELK
ncbi:GNAT family N-acetyltransferase [Mesorhizobium sp. ArgA1]